MNTRLVSDAPHPVAARQFNYLEPDSPPAVSGAVWLGIGTIRDIPNMIACKRCGQVATRKRRAQVYCSKRCRDADAQRRKRSADISADLLPERRSADGDSEALEAGLRPYVWPTLEESKLNPDGSTPGALQGDDYQLEYYEDGFPMLPACLDRRRVKLELAA